jgi:hypothetical protein
MLMFRDEREKKCEEEKRESRKHDSIDCIQRRACGRAIPLFVESMGYAQNVSSQHPTQMRGIGAGIRVVSNSTKPAFEKSMTAQSFVLGR